MLGISSLQPSPKIFRRATHRDAPSPIRAHGQNLLLAAMPAEFRARILPLLSLVPLRTGCTIYAGDAREAFLYFVTDGIVSHVYETQEGESMEVAVTGSEGVVGIAPLLGGESMTSTSIVTLPGHAYRMDASILDAKFGQVGALRQVLLKYMQALITHVGQVAACSRHHCLEQRLCFWILTRLDRMSSLDLPVTHEQIAYLMGVRREGITELAGKMQKAGLIQNKRGHVVAIDRRRLEAWSCECYAVVAHEYERLLPPCPHDRTASGNVFLRGPTHFRVAEMA